MDTRHLRAAVEVARCGSFTRAARELHMAQSTLSRHVQSLERDLGRPLFVRGLPAVTLTPAGKAFLPEAERVLEAVARAQDAVVDAVVDAVGGEVGGEVVDEVGGEPRGWGP